MVAKGRIDILLTATIQPITLTVAEIASNLEIFQTLVESNGSPTTAAALAAVRGADVVLVGRL